jgi:hypothetical protein
MEEKNLKAQHMRADLQGLIMDLSNLILDVFYLSYIIIKMTHNTSFLIGGIND